MALIKSKPVSPGRRGKVSIDRSDLYRGGPLKILTKAKARTAGRNSSGRITMRHRGGGHRRKLRTIDFLRNKDEVVALVIRIEYDPNRSAHIALLRYTDGEHRYILALKGMTSGDHVQSGSTAPVRRGTCRTLAEIPLGSILCCVELKPGRGAQFARAAGASVQLAAFDGDYALLRMRSGEMRKIHSRCRATIGEIGNAEHFLRKLGKAGAARWRGRRPKVRGMVMNPVDHPMGGGEGRSKSNRIPCSPTGIPAKGYRTRRGTRRSDAMIISRRKNKGGR